MSKDLFEYIKQARDQNHSDQAIEDSLIEAGWDEALVKGALLEKHIPKKKHRIIKVALITLGVIGAIALFILYLPNIYNLVVIDDQLLDNSSLALRKIDINPEDNAFLDIEKLGGLIDLSKAEDRLLIDYVGQRKEVDKTLIPAILEKNKEAIQFFSDMSNKPYFQDPDFMSGEIIVSQVTALSPLRQISRLIFTKSELGMALGESDKAYSDAEFLLKSSQAMLKGQNDTIVYLVGLSLRSTSARIINNILKVTTNEDLIAEIKSNLEQYRFEKEDYINLVKLEYNLHTKLIDLMYQKDSRGLALYYGDVLGEYGNTFKYGLFSVSLVTQLNKTKNLYTEYVENLINSTESICDLVQENPPRLPEPSVWEMVYAKNHLRNDFYNGFVVGTNMTAKKTCESIELFNQF